MAREKRMEGMERRGTRERDARERGVAPSGVRAFRGKSRNALAGGRGSVAPFGKFNGDVRASSQKMGFTSCGAPSCRRRRGSIRKNIIGHRMPFRFEQFLARGVLRGARRAFALLDEPASEHGAGIFFHPLIEQGANFLAEIGGMAETGKLVALERIARSREKKFPRRLSLGARHVGLLETDACKVTNQ